ncbi:MAG: putative monooxygenase MoxC [Xylophilus sp.]|nr:MAG: putative monooxygenase MoxC [Xylophilus sp.]
MSLPSKNHSRDDRRIILGAYYLVPNSHYTEVWRHPYSETDFAGKGIYQRLARFLESSGFDLAFIPESLAAPRGDDGSLARGLEAGELGTIRPDPTILAQAITDVTRTLAVGVTLSTTFWEPYHIARLFGSLNHFSGGRVAWNIITSGGDDNARSFGSPQLPEHDSRYDRADHVVEAASQLWQSWQPDALVADKESGVFADPRRVTEVHYDAGGVALSGTLTLPRAPGGGRPVFIQAGESERGRDFAARWAEFVFSIQNTAENLKSLRDDVRLRAGRLGRGPDAIRLLAAIIPVIGETDEIAQARSRYLTDRIEPLRAARRLARNLGIAVPENLDVPLVAVAGDLEALPKRIRRVAQEVPEAKATFRYVATQIARSSSTAWVVGSPRTVADQLQEFCDSESVDGFIITPTHFPGSFEEFGRSVVPILRDRGLIREPETGSVDFRSRLGLGPVR